MAAKKGKTKPFDGTTWLDAFQKAIRWGEPHQWRLDELEVMKIELRAFFEEREKNQMPRKKLKRIEQERHRLARDLYSPGLIEQMEQELDNQEIQMYKYLLGAEHYSAVTQSIPRRALTRKWTQGKIKAFIKRLRKALSHLPDKEKRLRTPIGTKLSAGSKKMDGLSWKSAAIVGAYIFSVYELFQPFYKVTGRGWNKKKSPESEKKDYPFPLIRDIGRFFREEFDPWLKDLKDEDIISRIQYGQSRKVKRNMVFSHKKGKGAPP